MCILANCGNLSVKGKLGVQYDTKSMVTLSAGVRVVDATEKL